MTFFQAKKNTTNLDIREVCLNHNIHYTPYVCNGILVPHRNFELLSDETSCSLTTKEVFRFHSLFLPAIHMCQVDLNRILWVNTIVLKPSNRPRSQNRCAILLHIRKKDPLNKSLVQ